MRELYSQLPSVLAIFLIGVSISGAARGAMTRYGPQRSQPVERNNRLAASLPQPQHVMGSYENDRLSREVGGLAAHGSLTQLLSAWELAAARCARLPAHPVYKPWQAGRAERLAQKLNGRV